jgi:hypothetical protein
MLSRTADHLYWMARDMERAGQVAKRPAAKPQYGDARQRISGVFGPVAVLHVV